jgi:hypothetical protein
MGSTSMPGKSRSSSAFEEGQHAEGLPLLVAHEADALALECVESRRVRLPRLEPARWLMEFERHHDLLLLWSGAIVAWFRRPFLALPRLSG